MYASAIYISFLNLFLFSHLFLLFDYLMIVMIIHILSQTNKKTKREEISLSMSQTGSLLSLSYTPLVSPLAAQCHELQPLSSSTNNDREYKFQTLISYSTATPGMALPKILPKMKTPPGLNGIKHKRSNNSNPQQQQQDQGQTNGNIGGIGGGASARFQAEEDEEQKKQEQNQSFLRRYWYIILPITIMTFFGGEEPQQQRPPQQRQGGGATENSGMTTASASNNAGMNAGGDSSNATGGTSGTVRQRRGKRG